MKILLLHTFYQVKGGEDSVFMQESELLKKAHSVKILSFQNQSGWRGALQFFMSIWNIIAAARLKKVIKEFKPDVIHIHNLHFAIGPIAIRVADNMGVPITMTIHNYRLLCPSGILQHKGEIFTDSLYSSFPWNAIKSGVYRGSKFQTFWLAYVNWTHKNIGTWKKVSNYIVLTDFARELFLKSSLQLTSNQVIVKSNFMITPQQMIRKRGEHFLFVGRLMEEKGINVILKAFENSELKLKIAGSGPLTNQVVSFCATHENVTYLGDLDKTSVLNVMAQCSALIFPSTWYEGMPMTILESFSLGTPVIGSDIGAMKTMITDKFNGLHFEVGNSKDLIQKLRYFYTLTPEEKKSLQNNAMETFNKNYTADSNIERLIKIYELSLTSELR